MSDDLDELEAPGVGHNSGDETVHGLAKNQLKSFVERIERLEEEKSTVAEDIKEVYAEVKAMGFDTKALRSVIRIRKQDQEKRKEEEAVLETYLLALGML